MILIQAIVTWLMPPVCVLALWLGHYADAGMFYGAAWASGLACLWAVSK